MDSEPEDLRDLVWNEPQQAHVARTFEEFVDGMVSAKDQVTTVLDLLNRVVTAQVDRIAIFLRELGADQKSPVVEPFLDDAGAQTVSGSLQRFGIGGSQEGVVIFAEPHVFAQQFPLDETVTVQPVADPKR